MIPMLSLEIARGIRIVVPGQVGQISTYVFLEQEDWFEEEAPFVASVAEPGGRMLDIGSSYGYYGLTYARFAGPGGRVWAFEPTPEVCRHLRESIRQNGFTQLTLIETAVGAAAGRSFLTPSASSELNAVDPTEGKLEVSVAALDDLARTHEFGSIDFVKLDVEGAEAAVIAGGRDFFTRESPLVMFEIRAGSAIDFTPADRFRELGYSLYRLVPQLGVLVPLEADFGDRFLLNVFACKPDRAARLAGRHLLCPAVSAVPPLASVEAVSHRLRQFPALQAHLAYFTDLLSRFSPEDPALQLIRLEMASRDPALALPARVAALAHAAGIAYQFVADPGSGTARRLTAARILCGWGARGAAAEVLLGMLPAVLAGEPITLDAPFLPPLAEYESVAGDIVSWISAGVIEAGARWGSFSSLWGEPTDPLTTDVLARYGRHTPLLERRRQLRLLLTGKQEGLLAHPSLAVRSPANLNPEIWCGSAQS